MYKFLHTRVRVSDLERSIKWYCDNLGFRVKRAATTVRQQAIKSFIWSCPGTSTPLEFTYSPDYKLDVPEDLLHFAIGVPDLTAFCEELEQKGLEIWPDNWREAFAKAIRWPS